MVQESVFRPEHGLLHCLRSRISAEKGRRVDGLTNTQRSKQTRKSVKWRRRIFLKAHTCPESPCALNAHFYAIYFITENLRFLDLHAEKSGAPERILIGRRKRQKKKDYTSMSCNK